MLGLKINHLVDLQDARYCASFGADYLVFSLERGHNQKIPEKTVRG